jgi:hypothetical protein
MRYMLLIYSDPATDPQPGTQEFEQQMKEYYAFTKQVQDGGAYLAGEALKDVQTATTVRIRNGNRMVTDGPFAETKEHLGGFYMINANDLDEAIKIGAMIPTATHGSIEVRPIMEFN